MKKLNRIEKVVDTIKNTWIAISSERILTVIDYVNGTPLITYRGKDDRIANRELLKTISNDAVLEIEYRNRLSRKGVVGMTCSKV